MSGGFGHALMLRSTPPSREATRDEGISEFVIRVAIHAPLAGGDQALWVAVYERMMLRSTPPSREATRPLRIPEEA